MQRSINDYSDGEVFKPGERWKGPRGTCYYVQDVQIGGNATLRPLSAPWAEPTRSRLRRVPWDGILNGTWVRYAGPFQPATADPPAAGQPRPLSPAAQAVLDAVLSLYSSSAAADMARPLELPAITAVIRALAQQAGSSKHWHINELRTIAAELEGADA